MSPKEFTAFRIEPEWMAGLRKVKERDLIPLSVQVDQALRVWLKSRGIAVEKAERKRVAPRKRS